MFRVQTMLVGIALAAVLGLTGCSAFGASDTTSSTVATPAGSPTPTVPAGYYAFVRNGDVWARNGLAPAHPVTFLHLSASVTTWGPLSWSPDRTMLAFILRAPPFTPPFAAGAPSQGIGTLFLVNLTTGVITSLHGGAAPLLGQHIAWVNATTLLFTQNGTIEQATIGAAITIAPLTGPKSVWEIAVRNGTLFYSTLTNITPSGTGSAELHSFVLNGSDHHDQMLATLGPATLPATICGLVCAPDATTPYVPFAWTVSADGTQIAYQQQSSNGAAATATSVPTPTVTPGPTGTLTSPPATTRFVLAHADGTQTQPLFAQIPLPTGRVDLAFAPNGQHIALAADMPGTMLYTPYIQALGSLSTSSAAQPPVAITPATAGQVTLSGPLTWTPDNTGISLTQNMLPLQVTAVAAITFTLLNQSVLTEQSAADFVWAV